jgi:hypothetical protein
MLFKLGSASTAARVPATAQASRPRREDAVLSHMMDCMDNTKERYPLALGWSLPVGGGRGLESAERRTSLHGVPRCRVDRLYGKFAAF